MLWVHKSIGPREVGLSGTSRNSTTEEVSVVALTAFFTSKKVENGWDTNPLDREK